MPEIAPTIPTSCFSILKVSFADETLAKNIGRRPSQNFSRMHFLLAFRDPKDEAIFKIPPNHFFPRYLKVPLLSEKLAKNFGRRLSQSFFTAI